jgi:hypothetical protein
MQGNEQRREWDNLIWTIPPAYLAQIVEMVRTGRITRQTGLDIMEGYFAAMSLRRAARHQVTESGGKEQTNYRDVNG